jgi:hypothetical protein
VTNGGAIMIEFDMGSVMNPALSVLIQIQLRRVKSSTSFRVGTVFVVH